MESQAQISYSSSLAPKLTLSLSPPDEIQTNLSIPPTDGILIKLQREKDDDPRPFVFKWVSTRDFFNLSTVTLFRISSTADNSKSDIPEKQEVQLPTQEDQVEPQAFIVRQNTNDNVFELGPGKSISFKHGFPKSWREILVAGEKYELFWKSDTKIALWDWGSAHEYTGRRLEVKEEAKRIHLRYSSHESDEPRMLMRFTAVAKNKYSQHASVVRTFKSLDLDLPTTPKTASGAPILSVSLGIKDASEELKQGNGYLKMNFRARVTYHGFESADSAAASPITFHCNTFLDEIHYKLYYRHRDEDVIWVHCPHRSICHFLADDPNPVFEVNVASSEDFVSLQPGESWSAIIELDDELWDFPNNLQPGDVFRFVFTGATVVWWDWGSKDLVHTQTVVTAEDIPLGSVVDPADNGGRPELVVPTSNQVEFAFAG